MKSFFHLILALATIGGLFAAPAPVRAAGTVIEVNTLDGGVTDDGLCSIREAITAAGSNTDVVESGPVVACPAGSAVDRDTISFDLPGAGVQTITLSAYLPINTPVLIDGTTDPEFAGTPVVRFDGAGALIYGVYFESASDGSALRGVMATRFTYGNVSVSGSDGTQILGNYLGTDGTNDLGGHAGLRIEGAANVLVGGTDAADRNVIAGNLADISVNNGSSGASIRGNYIGLFADGVTVPSGSSKGIEVTHSCCSEGSAFNAIGGLGAGEGNVIAGHGVAEIYIHSSGTQFSDNNTIQGNIIGLDRTGTSAASVTLGDGIKIVNSDNTRIEGNVISGKFGSAVVVEFDATASGTPLPPDGTIIKSNKIGTSLNGMADLGSGTGVFLYQATNTIVGGNGVLAERNLISGNGNGIDVQGGSGNVIDTNTLGVNAAGTSSLPNTNNGLYLDSIVQVSRNWIANSVTGIYLAAAGDFSSSVNNCVTGNTTIGLENASGAPVTFEENWWGAADGPGPVGPGSGDTVSVDVGFSPFLTTAPLACSMLKNPSFETDANSDQKPDNWSLKKFNAATDGRDCTVAKSESCSLRLVGNGNQKTASQAVVVSGIAGDEFSFSLRSKASSVPTGSVYRLQVKFYDGSTLLSTANKDFKAGTHAFKQVQDTFTAPGPYTKVVYKILFKAASGTAWFDDAVLAVAP